MPPSPSDDDARRAAVAPSPPDGADGGAAVAGRTRGRGLSEQRVVAAARELLVTGGPDQVVVREVARRLGVAPSSLYKHVAGRDDILTLLIAECWAELASACEHALDGAPTTGLRARLRATSLAFRAWALAHPAEYQLVLGYPLPGYVAPPGGPTDAASRRVGAAFYAQYDAARRAGRLRTPVLPPPQGVAGTPRAGAALPEFSVDETYLFVMGFQRLQGLVAFEVSGQQLGGITDHAAYVLDQVERLLDEILTPGD
ncbi:TetR/AcrR family transcriptional regulator [Cellulomonas sp. S1-8]|uniref:TetR/AcrR family transcriptional regulator n=1 Tax=Cellulomonas sp. S1-8 TaxID=2904790 RepID=UPI002242E721|nr:TetR/AcrR family transcriptional regulator [Cellulomonas sp. S1-8]UZN03751.1 TetR/AcrR family transcriptional regulator [Cellulomonas sp. S1-8]